MLSRHLPQRLFTVRCRMDRLNPDVRPILSDTPQWPPDGSPRTNDRRVTSLSTLGHRHDAD